MSLFAPNPLSRNADRAIKAVRALDDETKLTAAATKHPSHLVRLEAVKRLHNPRILAQIIRTDKSDTVRRAAIKPTCDCGIYDSEERKRNESIVFSDSALYEFALGDGDLFVVEQALRKLRSSALALEAARHAIGTQRAETAFACYADRADADVEQIAALLGRTAYPAVIHRIVERFAGDDAVLQAFALSTSDFSVFRKIIGLMRSKERIDEVLAAKSLSVPTCSLCGRPAFAFARLDDGSIACKACISESKISEFETRDFLGSELGKATKVELLPLGKIISTGEINGW